MLNWKREHPYFPSRIKSGELMQSRGPDERKSANGGCNTIARRRRETKRRVDARPETARNCPITGSSWYISFLISRLFPPVAFFSPPSYTPSVSSHSACNAREYMHADSPGPRHGEAQSKRDKIYKYVGGARDPFQCLFNQE